MHVCIYSQSNPIQRLERERKPHERNPGPLPAGVEINQITEQKLNKLNVAWPQSNILTGTTPIAEAVPEVCVPWCIARPWVVETSRPASGWWWLGRFVINQVPQAMEGVEGGGGWPVGLIQSQKGRSRSTLRLRRIDQAALYSLSGQTDLMTSRWVRLPPFNCISINVCSHMMMMIWWIYMVSMAGVIKRNK